MKRDNINFHKSTSDRRAERVMKASYFRRLEPIVNFSRRLNNHVRSKIPDFRAKLTGYTSRLKGKR